MSIKTFTDEELAAEIKRRKEEAKKIPEILDDVKPIDFFYKIVEFCKSYFKQIQEEKYDDDDNKHYLYELVLTTLFGTDIFKKMKALEE